MKKTQVFIKSLTRFAILIVNGLILASPVSAQWTQTNGPLGCQVHTLVASGTNLYVGVWGVGVYSSTNNGSSWTAVNHGLTSTYVNTIGVDGTTLLAGTDVGISRSTDNGANWADANTGLPNVACYAFAVSGSKLFAGTTSGLFF